MTILENQIVVNLSRCSHNYIQRIISPIYNKGAQMNNEKWIALIGELKEQSEHKNLVAIIGQQTVNLLKLWQPQAIKL